MEGGHRVNRRYIAVLAACAALVLAIGSFVRHLLSGDDSRNTAPPSQAAAFQQLSQEGQLRRSAAYIAERVAAAAEYVVYVPSAARAGVRWGRDSVVSTDSAHMVVALTGARLAGLPRSESDSIRRSVTLAPDTLRRDWLFVVSRDASGSVLSTTVLAGGRSRTHCGDRTVETYMTGAPLDERLVGGGIFSVEAELLGLVVWCGRQVVAMPARDIVRALAMTTPPHDTIRTRYGFAVAAPDSLARAYTGSDSALLVVAVQRGSAADVAGLQAGDVVVGVDSAPAAVDWMRAWAAGPATNAHTIQRRPGRVVSTVTLRPPERSGAAALGIGVVPTAARGVPITTVLPASAAASVGLRAGDRLLRVGDAAVTSLAVAQRLLASAGDALTLVVYERDGTERAALLRAKRDGGSLPAVTEALRALEGTRR